MTPTHRPPERGTVVEGIPDDPQSGPSADAAWPRRRTIRCRPHRTSQGRERHLTAAHSGVGCTGSNQGWRELASPRLVLVSAWLSPGSDRPNVKRDAAADRPRCRSASARAPSTPALSTRLREPPPRLDRSRAFHSRAQARIARRTRFDVGGLALAKRPLGRPRSVLSQADADVGELISEPTTVSVESDQINIAVRSGPPTNVEVDGDAAAQPQRCLYLGERSQAFDDFSRRQHERHSARSLHARAKRLRT